MCDEANEILGRKLMFRINVDRGMLIGDGPSHFTISWKLRFVFV